MSVRDHDNEDELDPRDPSRTGTERSAIPPQDDLDDESVDEDIDDDDDSPAPGSPRGELPKLNILYGDDQFGDEEAEFDDEDEDDVEDGRRAVLITGASGNIGRKLRGAFEDRYDLVLLDIENPDGDPAIIEADLAEWDDDWIMHFHSVDTVIHLAGNPNEFAPWEELLYPNIDAMANVFHAAVLAGVERLIFASSNHAMGEYRYIEGLEITVDLPPKPDGPYGGLKLVGERLGRSLAKAFDISFIAIRLGWVQPGENRPETLPHDWAKTHWLSNRDMVQLFECAIETDLEERESVVVNGVSRNSSTRWDLTPAIELLGYDPIDNAHGDQ
jgi:nucleoside-diphosphate-sugar epimerase